jgi:transposase-like protein
MQIMDNEKTAVLKRNHSDEFKKQVVLEVLQAKGKESLSAIARKHRLSAPLLFQWRKNHDQANKKPRGKMMMLEDKSEKQQMPLFDPLDLELQAMNAIYNALKPLDNGCRKRVMDWVAQRVIYVS